LSGLTTAILNLLRAMYVSMGSLIVTGFNGGFVQATAGIPDGTNELFPYRSIHPADPYEGYPCPEFGLRKSKNAT
jgi:hypothetical protein